MCGGGSAVTGAQKKPKEGVSMRAMVTGANGFVGRYLLAELDSAGYELLAVDLADLSGITQGTFPGSVIYRKCDLTDAGSVNGILAEWKPGYIFHLAAQSSAARSFTDPGGTFEANLISTLNLLEADRNISLKAKIVLTGSSEEYGRRSPEEMPLTETSPVEPVSPYAASKAAQNLLGMQYSRTFGSRVIMTRSFSHTGPGQTTVFVLPSFAKQCAEIRAGRNDPVIRTGNLDVIRDFLDVRDVVRAYRLLMEKGREAETYNVCRGEGLDLGKALDAMVAAIGVEVVVKTDAGLLRPVDVPVLVGDNTKLKADTGWEPVISADTMLEDLVAWWQREGAGA